MDTKTLNKHSRKSLNCATYHITMGAFPSFLLFFFAKEHPRDCFQLFYPSGHHASAFQEHDVQHQILFSVNHET